MSKRFILNWPLIWAAVIFVLCLAIGHALSLRRPLWNDEIYSQVVVVDPVPYQDMILLRPELEGNSCPLFYLIQKGVSDLFQYQFPFHWDREGMISEEGSQVIMRLAPNFFMSLSIALIFYFFARSYSIGAGVYALLMTFSSFMVWAYWVEARPYALWFFLTTCQSILFLFLIKDKKNNPTLWNLLAAVHILLSLTLILGAMQIVIVSFLLWVSRERSWKKYILVTAVPLGICYFYYLRSVLHSYSEVSKPLQLISQSVSPERFLIFAVYFVFFACYGWYQRKKTAQTYSALSEEGAGYGVLFLSMVISAFLFLLMMAMKPVAGQEHVPLSGRYFIYLVPVGIIATTLFSLDFIRLFQRQHWLLVNIVISLSGLLAFRFLRTCSAIFGF